MTAQPIGSRFWEKVDLSGECWTWTAAHYSNGYAIFSVANRNALAHRIAWESEHGPIPEGLTVDHLCRTRDCVRVEHMELVTRGDNSLRGGGIEAAAAKRRAVAACPQGHPYDDANTYRDKKGRRGCVECRRTQSRAWYRRKAAAR